MAKVILYFELNQIKVLYSEPGKIILYFYIVTKI